MSLALRPQEITLLVRRFRLRWRDTTTISCEFFCLLGFSLERNMVRLRGAARETVLERLRVLDRRLLEAARTACDASTLDGVVKEADGLLAAFRDRMATEIYAQSRAACVDRLIRDRLHLPTVTFE